jgi:hypothetical protein
MSPSPVSLTSNIASNRRRRLRKRTNSSRRNRKRLFETLERRYVLDSALMFNEVMYAPDGGDALEWIEFHNPMSIDVDVSKWEVQGGVTFTFPEGTFVGANDYLVVARDPVALANSGVNAAMVGPYSGQLSNNGELLELFDRSERLMDDVQYNDRAPWSIEPDGSGASLAKRQGNLASQPYASWTSSVVVGGTPGEINFDIGDSARAIEQHITLLSDWKYEDSNALPAADWMSPGFDDQGWDSGDAILYAGNPGINSDAELVEGVVATASSELTGFDRKASYTVDGSGLTNNTHTITPDGFMWLNEGTFGNGPADLTPDITFDLGQVRSIDQMKVWNYNEWLPGRAELLGRGISSADVLIAGEDQVFSTFITNQAFPIAPGTNTDFSQLIDFNGTSARYVKLDIHDNFPNGDNNFVGLSEVQFFENASSLGEELTNGATTYYFRKDFDFQGDPDDVSLYLRSRVDDGAVFYLNGTEVGRVNMPAGNVVHSTLASGEVVDVSLSEFIQLNENLLSVGTNVFAVEVHQFQAVDTDMAFDLELMSVEKPAEAVSPGPAIVINEIAAVTEPNFWFELHNFGDTDVVLDSYNIDIGANTYQIPSATLVAGDYRLIDQAEMGFGAAVSDEIILRNPAGSLVVDVARVTNSLQGLVASDANEFSLPSAATPAAANTFQFQDEIVINEIMYSSAGTYQANNVFSASDEEWIELYNRTNDPVDIGGWTLSRGVDYVFPLGTQIGGDEYLVVAKDSATLQVKYPLITIVGDYSGRLNDQTDEIVLRDLVGNVADYVQYYDNGNWPAEADAGGSSLELRHPDSDNSAASAWNASDESTKSAWQNISYEGTVQASQVGPDGTWNELVLGLMDEGTILLDNISVIRDPFGAATQQVANGGFELDALGDTPASWRLLGNQRHGEIAVDPTDLNNQVLRYTATGATEHMHNHAATTLFSTIQNGVTYRISFDAKWESGTNLFNSRLYFNRLPQTTVIDRPVNNGTPGEVNSLTVVNDGPILTEFEHSPAVPHNVEPVTVNVAASDVDGIGIVELWYSVDSGAWSSAPMNLNGASYQGLIPPHSTGSIIQFYVTAEDQFGNASNYPREGADSRALYQVNDGKANTTGLHNMRLILTPDDADLLHTDIHLMSNDRIGATVIYDESEVYYDVGIRLSGSERARPFTGRLSFNVRFNSEQLFRGVHQTVALDRSESTGFGQQELLTHQVSAHVGMVPAEYNDLIHIITPRQEHTGSAELQLGRYTDVMLDAQFNNGGDGRLFEYELVYFPTTANGEGYKLPQPDGVIAGLFGNMGTDPESYRWNFLIKNNREEDDFTQLIPFLQTMSLTGAAFNDTIDDFIDVDQWLRGFALATVSGAGDNFGQNDRHNAQFYIRPDDGRVLYFPHDLDAFLSTTRPIAGSSELNKLIAVPTRAHMYYGHVYDMLQTTYNSAYMSHWTNQIGQLLPAQNFAGHLNFISQRNSFLLGQINNVANPTNFTLTTNSPLDVGNNIVANVSGRGWVDVREIRLAGSSQPLDVTWTTTTNWQLPLTVGQGTNTYTLEAYDFQGVLIDTVTIDITSSAVDGRIGDSLRITEVNYHPHDSSPAEIAAGYDDSDEFEFIELQNIGTEPINLAGVSIVDAVEFTFGNVTLGQDEYIVVVENELAFEVRYGNGINVEGVWSGGLSNNSDTIILLDPQNVVIQQFQYQDSGSWPGRADGTGSTLEMVDPLLDPADASSWRSSSEFGGTPGGVGIGNIGDIVINEVMTHTDLPESDWIELYNTTTQPIPLDDYYLSDSNGNLLKFAIPDGTTIPGLSYLVFDEDDFNLSLGVDPNDFSLNSAHGDDAWLVETDEGAVIRFVDHVDFIAGANGESFGRWPNATGVLYPMLQPTRGDDNFGPRVGPLVFSEVMYHPVDPDGVGGIDPNNLEFVEIINPTAAGVDLTNWQITGGIDFAFAGGQMIGTDELLVVVPFDPTDPVLAAEFRTTYGIGIEVELLGPYLGQLDNDGERIRLRRPDGPPADEPNFIPLLLEDETDYNDNAAWPAADGTGDSLTRVGEDLWGNDPASWFANTPTPGAVDVLPPTVTGFSINSEFVDPADLPKGPQPTSWQLQRSDLRSLKVEFSKTIIVDPSEIVLTNLGISADADPDQIVSLDAGQIDVDGSTLTITLELGQLLDGVYQLELLGTITSPDGLQLDGDANGVGGDSHAIAGNDSNHFARLAANWNGDTGVSVFDFTTFSYWFGLGMPTAPKYADLNDDNGVSVFDFTPFANNFGVGVIYPVAFAAMGNAIGNVETSPLQLIENSDDTLPSTALVRQTIESVWEIDRRRDEATDELLRLESADFESLEFDELDWALEAIAADIVRQ